MRIFNKYTLFLILGIASWLVVTSYIIFKSLTSVAQGIDLSIPDYAVGTIFLAFISFNLLFVNESVKRIEKWDVIDLLWKILVIGISGVAITFVFQLLEHYLADRAIIRLIEPLAAGVKLYAFFFFVTFAIFIYRKLIYYHKTKRKVTLWRIFEVLMLISIAFLFDPHSNIYSFFGSVGATQPDPYFTLYIRSAVIPAFFIITLVISANVNWSAYLNFNQKLKSLFLVFVISLLFGAYYLSFPHEFFNIDKQKLFFDVMGEAYISLGLFFYFPLIYTIVSGLVLIFNLPTSSVFEQRTSEIASFQRINQSIQSSLDPKEIYSTLLDATLLTSNSVAGWIKVIDKQEGNSKIKYTIEQLKSITQEEIFAIDPEEEMLREDLENEKYLLIKNAKRNPLFKDIKSKYRSLLMIPIMSRSTAMGYLFLVHELTASYEEETILTLVAFAEQSAIAIENAGLIRKSIEYERYSEQLKIARQVQAEILPSELPSNEQIEFVALTQDAEEIGGDYYDVSLFGEYLYKVAVGDISGKGTEAAFYMAETKGIFQALTQMDMGVNDFILNANGALSNCLKADSFMTMVYLHIDLEKKMIEMARAGHVPALFYNAEEDMIKYHEEGGLGLGVVRNGSFENYVKEPLKINYQTGDLLVLYTDGIVEARNVSKEEFGFDRLKEVVFTHRKGETKEIAQRVLEEVKGFAGEKIEDDYTLLVIRLGQENLKQSTINN